MVGGWFGPRLPLTVPSPPPVWQVELTTQKHDHCVYHYDENDAEFQIIWNAWFVQTTKPFKKYKVFLFVIKKRLTLQENISIKDLNKILFSVCFYLAQRAGPFCGFPQPHLRQYTCTRQYHRGQHWRSPGSHPPGWSSGSQSTRWGSRPCTRRWWGEGPPPHCKAEWSPLPPPL